MSANDARDRLAPRPMWILSETPRPCEHCGATPAAAHGLVSPDYRREVGCWLCDACAPLVSLWIKESIGRGIAMPPVRDILP